MPLEIRCPTMDESFFYTKYRIMKMWQQVMEALNSLLKSAIIRAEKNSEYIF